MAITDKTRKRLWAKSGNLCAICKYELVVNATSAEDESVVGDECHIISPRSNGPRHDSSYPQDKLDTYENLILLCRVHHKMVDDQDETYTVDILRQTKTNHEIWVSQKLSGTSEAKPVRVRRVKQNIPSYLTRLTTGREVLNLVMRACAALTDHDELKSPEEVNLVGSFLQTVQDCGDIGSELEPKDQVETAFDLTMTLEELEQAGFFVFGGREVRLLKGGAAAQPTDWPVAIIHVLRKDNDAIIRMNLHELRRDK